MLDPRTKLFICLVYAVTVFLADSLRLQTVTLAVLAAMLVISGVPLKNSLKKTLKNSLPVIIVAVIAGAVSVLLAPDRLQRTAVVTLRVFELVVVFNLLSLTTKPKDMAAAIEKIIPSHSVATMLAIALRFLPLLSEEAVRIIQAQRSRGAGFDGSLVKRAKQTAPVLVPLFVSAFRRADDLSTAIDARLYGTAVATRLHPLKFRTADLFLFALSLLYLAAFVVVRFLCLN